IKADLSDHASVPSIFQNVKSEFGVAPSVVVYNAYAMTPLPEPDSPLSAPVAGLLSDLNVNTISAYVAAQEALKGFEELPNEARKAFIYTGNWLNTVVVPMPMVFALGVGKSASAYWIGAADGAYASKGYR